MATGVGRIRRSPTLVRIGRARPRLFTCGLIGAVVTALVAFVTAWRPSTRMLTGWDVGVALYLALVFRMMMHAKIHAIRQRAAEQDEGRSIILVLTMAAALASLATILLSWALIHTTFALHYAHEFYDETDSGGLAFPGDDREPDYWDFVYFSFVIGMTSQVSDVTISSKQIRRTVTAHGVVSFVFNAALLALTVNLAASAL